MPPVSVLGKFDFLDVGGSLNDGQPPNAIADNEWQQLWNMYQFGTRLRRRGGMAKETDNAASENLTGLHVLNTQAGARYLLAGGLTRIWRQDGEDLVALQRLEGGLFNPTPLPWVTAQRNDIVYWMRRDNGGLRRSSYDFVQNAGILAPVTAPALADGGAGDLTAGDYLGVVTFYNTLTGVESNPSAASASLTLGASKKIDWSAIPISSNPQVNARRLYRTVPNQTGRYFFVAQINDNSTTTYTGDNVVIQDLGIAASFRNGVPPSGIELGDFWKERLFCSDGIDQFYSEAGNPESFDPSAVIPVFRNDGHRISANHAFGDRFIIGKTNKIHYLLGTDPSDFSLHTLSDKHGCWSHHSMKSAEGNLFWYGGDNVYRSDGASVYSISTIKVKNALAVIPEDERARVVGAVWPEQSWYVLTIPTDATGINRTVLVYNYKTDVWTQFTYQPTNGLPSPPAAFAPAFILSDFNEDDAPTLYATFYDGRIWKLESGLTDDGHRFDTHMKSRAHDFGAVGLTKFLYRVYLRTNRLTSTVDLPQVAITIDDPDGAYGKNRFVSLNSTRPWKRINMSTLGKPGYTISLALNYEGSEHLELDAYSMEILVQPRAQQPF